MSGERVPHEKHVESQQEDQLLIGRPNEPSIYRMVYSASKSGGFFGSPLFESSRTMNAMKRGEILDFSRFFLTQVSVPASETIEISLNF
jgi:hypothetical protein